MNKVWSVTINGQNDCVVMTDEQAMVITLKFSPDIQIIDMTEKHGMTPEHMQKADRQQQLEEYGRDMFFEKWEGVGGFNHYVKADWTFEKLLAMEAI
tara:strand:- start:1629 stop:1919 length:291 start_codon:yes stop_codon:yes gene_type:complete